MKKIAFDQEKYLEAQTKEILSRVDKFEKLYLEVGGKLIDDQHAARVLPGFKPSAKIDLLRKLKSKLEIIVCVSALDIARNKVRADSGLDYTEETLRLIHYFKKQGFLVNNVVITLYDGKNGIKNFIKQLEEQAIKVHIHTKTKGYPTDVEKVVSKDGYGKNSFIKTIKPIVVVTAPGPSSGKMATALSQVYHEYLNGNKAGYAKYETFPVWDLGLNHPVNIAYEAATLDLMDVNLIDPFHLEAYGVQAVNYNRDIETFPVLKRIFNKIYGQEIYKSPTDMGVNMVSAGIVDDEKIRLAAKQEIIRRYFRTKVDNKLSRISDQAVEKSVLLMEKLDLKPEDRLVVKQSKIYFEDLNKRRPDYENEAVTIKYQNKFYSGKNTDTITALVAAIFNVLKDMAHIDDKLHLLSPEILKMSQEFKFKTLGLKQQRITLDEALLWLNFSSLSNPINRAILDNLSKLKGLSAHSTHLLDPKEQKIIKQLKIDLTIDT